MAAPRRDKRRTKQARWATQYGFDPADAADMSPEEFSAAWSREMARHNALVAAGTRVKRGTSHIGWFKAVSPGSEWMDRQPSDGGDGTLASEILERNAARSVANAERIRDVVKPAYEAKQRELEAYEERSGLAGGRRSWRRGCAGTLRSRSVVPARGCVATARLRVCLCLSAGRG
jgi:hypothetical protein